MSSRGWKFALGVLLFAVALPLWGAVDNSTIGSSYVLVADGMVLNDSIPPTVGGPDNLGTPQWFIFRAIANHSYVVDLTTFRAWTFNDVPQVKATFFSTINGSSEVALPGGTVNDVTGSDPAGGFVYSGPPIKRYAVTPATTTLVAFEVESDLNYQTASPQSFGVRLLDTTLVSARWTTNGYNAFVALHNSSESSSPIVVTYYDEAGAVLGTDTTTLAGHGSVQFLKTASDPTFGGRKGAVEVACRCAPGNITGQVYSVNVGNASLLQFPLVENRTYGRGTY